ncbi:MAG: hypothetical protein LUE29_04535 [Lachnospiraceae bacterium]|nr:hypothetical protein [Lachnospiraceae bacterium]
MSNRERAYQLLDMVPERKMEFAVIYLQGLTAGEEEIEPNAETVAAMEELLSGGGEEHDTLEDLWNSLEE